MTLTVNPALDVTTTIPRLAPARKLRCAEPRYDAGGGGVNVSRAIRTLGGKSTAFVVLGGGVGTHYQQVLADTNIPTVVWWLPGETRFCLTVAEQASGEHYRFVLPGPTHEAAVVEPLLQAVAQTLERGFDYVVLSGSLAPGLPDDFYARVIELARKAGAKAILDTSGAALRAALESHPYVVRLNRFEAQELLGGEVPDAVDAHQMARALVERGVADIATISVGSKVTVAVSRDVSVRVVPPHVEVRSTVGAGDSFVGAFVLSLARGWTLEMACNYAVAAATSAVTSDACELCERRATDAFFRDMTESGMGAGGGAERGVDT